MTGRRAAGLAILFAGAGLSATSIVAAQQSPGAGPAPSKASAPATTGSDTRPAAATTDPAGPTPVAARVATLMTLDKLTGATRKIEAHPGEAVTFGRLTIRVRTCETAPPWERPEAAAFLQVDETLRTGEVRRIYSGWMFAGSPALHPFDHAAYDVSFKSCKMSFPEMGAETSVWRAPSPPPPPAAEMPSPASETPPPAEPAAAPSATATPPPNG